MLVIKLFHPLIYWIPFYDSFLHIFFFNSSFVLKSFVFSICIKHNANNIIIYHNHLLNSFFMFLSHIFTYSIPLSCLKSSVFSIRIKHNNLILSNITINYWISFYDSFTHIFFFNPSFVFSIHLKLNSA